MHPLILVLFAVMLGAVGQILLKQGMGGLDISGAIGAKLTGILKAMLQPYVLAGLCCYVISTLFWLLVLTTQELSYVYPMIAIGYVLVTILSVIFLREHVPPLRWVSLGVICLGVAMLATLGVKKNNSESAIIEPSDTQITQPNSDATTR